MPKKRQSLRLRAALYVTEKTLGKAQRSRRSQFEILTPPPRSIVLLGDSITEGGMWDEWLPEYHVVNRGIGGETAAQVLERIDSVAYDPAAVFLLIGTNDLTLGYSIESITENVEKIIERVKELAPGAPIHVQSVMPRGPRWRQRVLRLNAAVSQVARRTGAQYVDLWPALEGVDGALKRNYTMDDLHLTGAGYRAWVEVLRPVMATVRRA